MSNGSFASINQNVKYLSEPNYAVLIRFADFSNGFDENKFVFIDEHAYNFLAKSKLNGGEIIISNVGSCGKLFRCPVLAKYKMSLAPNTIVVKTIDNSFYYYWFASQRGQRDIEKITSKSAMPKFNKTAFRELLVPLLSRNEREQIVEKLAAFEALIANVESEIINRTKQYEYYREQLLSF